MKHTIYELILYYDNVINYENYSLKTEKLTYETECEALQIGKERKYDNFHMFEIFAVTSYYQKNKTDTNRVNTVRYVNFKPLNNAFLYE